MTDDVRSVRAEVAPYVHASPAELFRHTADCARDAMWAIRASDVPDRALRATDPLPESTIVALRRLARDARRR